MEFHSQLATGVREFHFGKNWTAVDLKTHLSETTWKQATTQVHGLNTIAALTYHLNYYITAIIKVLKGGPLEANDLVSFDHPPIQSQQDWDNLVMRVYSEADQFASLVEEMTDDQLSQLMPDEKYGTLYRNIQGTIEHCYYHLGQIVLLKKIITSMH